DPPRPIPNRVVKHSSAEGTARLPCGRLGLCAIHYQTTLLHLQWGGFLCVSRNNARPRIGREVARRGGGYTTFMP
ncbi:MAG: hypothetical protein RL076_395, partial [Chloroflexota bacterium]